MGVFRQFGQLLWKNVLTRKREPHILILEIIWPILIFIIAALIRSAILPEDKQTCSYSPHAMPSAGLVPFLQSSVCNIGNKCENRTIVEARQTKASKLSALMSDVQPYLTKQSTLDALDSMETGVQLAEALVAITEPNSTISSFLGTDTMTLKNFFKDPGKVKRILIDELKVMNVETADTFLNSTVNVIELLGELSTGYIDFRGIVCDPAKLQKYMFFPKSANLTAVSHDLCHIPDSAISGITDMVLQQLDVAAIFRVAKSLPVLTNDYQLMDALDDMASMIDLLTGTKSFGAILSSSIDIKEMKKLLNNIPMYIDTFNKMGSVDTKSVDDLLAWVEPMVKTYTADLSTWNQTVDMFNQIKHITQAIGSGENTNWTALIQNGLSSLDVLLNNSSNMEWMKVFANLNSVPDLTNLTLAILSGDMESLNQLASADSLDSLQQSLTSILGEQTTQSMLGVIDSLIDMTMLAFEYLKETSQQTSAILKESTEAQQAIETVLSYGPNVTMEIMTRMTQVDNILILFNDTSSYVSVCHSIMTEVKDINSTTRAALDNALCTDDISGVLQQAGSLFDNKMLQKQMETIFMNMDSLISSTLVPKSMKLSTVFSRITNMTEMIVEWTNSSALLFDIESKIDMSKMEWPKVKDKMLDMTKTISWPIVVVTVGPVLEETDMWKTYGPIFRSINAFMDSTVKQMSKMNDASSSMGKMNEMLKYVMKYPLEITKTAFDMMKDPKLMDEVFSVKDMNEFCQKNMLMNISLATFIPSDDMKEINVILCETNWTSAMTEMVSTYDIASIMTEALSKIDENTTEPFDWVAMVNNIDEMMTISSSPNPMTAANPIATLLTMNPKMFDLLVQSVYYSVDEILQNKTMLTTTIFSMMELVDKMSTSDNFLNTIKVYLDVWNEFTVMTNKQIENQKFGVMELLNVSSTFSHLLESSMSTAPQLLEALKNTTLDTAKFFEVLLKGNLNSICIDTKITELLTSSSDLAQFEDDLCALNLTAILTEFMENVYYKSFTDKIAKYSDVDWDNVPDINLDWTALKQNSQKMLESLGEMDLGEMLFVTTWDDLAKKFDLQKANTTWNDFMSVFNMANGVDVQSLMKIFDGLNAVGQSLTTMYTNNTLEAMQADIVQSQMYQYHIVLQFVIKQLQYFNDTKHVDLRQYFKSNEMNKLFDVISFSPEVSTVAMITLIHTLQNPSKVNTLMTSWERMCSDLSVFKSILEIPANSSVDTAALQTKICGLNLNFTVLMEEIMVGIDGVQELMNSITDIKGRSSPSEVNKDYELLNKLMMDVFFNPPNITISDSNAWMMESEYAEAWENFVKMLEDGLKVENYMQTLPSITNQVMEGVITSLAADPEIKTILYHVSLYMGEIMKYLNNSLTITDFYSQFDGYPELKKLSMFLDNLPDLYQVWVYNSMYQINKISNLVSITSWEEFCSLTAPLLDVPGSTFRISEFQEKLCKINLTMVMTEAQEFQGTAELLRLMQALDSNFTADTIDTKQIVSKLNQLSKDLLDYIERIQTDTPQDMTLPNFLNMQSWLNSSDYLNSIIFDQERLMSLGSSGYQVLQNSALKDMLEQLVEIDPIFKQQVQMYTAGYLIIQHFITRIENKTVITPQDIFGNATETIKLWKLLIKPGVLETVLNSVNSKEMSLLFAKTNATEVIMLLCYTGDFSKYFSVPSYVSLDVNQLKTDFCSIDLMKVAQELMQEIHALESIITESTKNSTVIEWEMIAGLFGFDQLLTNQITALISNPPIIQLPPEWMHESYWLNVLVQYTESRQDPSQTALELQTAMDSLKPVLNTYPFTTIGFVMDTYLQLILDNLRSINGTTLSLDNLFKSIPVLADVYTTLQIKDDALNELLQSPMKNPEEFLKLMTMTDPYQYFCEDEKHWQVIFVVNSDVPAKLCTGNSSELFEQLLNDLKYSDFMSAMKNMSVLPDWTKIIQNSMELSELVTQMLTSNSIQLDMSKIYTSLSSYNNTDFLWKYIALFSEIGKLGNMTSMSEWKTLEELLTSTQMAAQISNKIIDVLVKPGNVLDFGAMVKNTSVVTALLNSIKIDFESMNGLFSGYLRSDEATKFISIIMDGEALSSFMCDVNQWQEVFSFPLSLDLSWIITSLCQENDTMKILEEQFHMEQIMPLIMNSMQQNHTLDIATLTSDIEKLTANLMILFNLTSAEFMGVDFDRLGNINMTELLLALDSEVAKLNTNYQDMYSKLIQSFLMTMDNSTATGDNQESQLPGYILAATNLWISIFNKQMAQYLDKPLNLTAVLSGSSVGRTIDMLLKDTSWIDELMGVQINPQKVSDMLMQDTSSICAEGFWETVVTSGDVQSIKNVLKSICGLNESVILEEAMSGFINSHLFNQQLIALTEEYNNGNKEWNLTSLSPNIMEMTNILMTLFQQTNDFSRVLNVTMFSTVLEKLERMMTQDLEKKLTEWSSLLFPFLPSMDQTTVKATQTLNLIINEMNSQLKNMQGTVSLSSLLNNSTELEDIFMLRIGNNGTDAVLSNKVDISKLSQVIASPTLFTGLCQNKTLADFITPVGIQSPIADDLEKVMCLYPDAFLQVLMDQTKSQELQTQIENIWSSNSTMPVDWQSIQKSISTFTGLLTGLIEQPPPLDGNLMTMLDPALIMKSLEGLFQNPQMLFSLAGSLSSALDIPVDMSVYPYYLSWQELYKQMEAVIKSLEGSPASTNGAVQNLWNALSSLNSQLGLIQPNASYSDLVAQLGKDLTLQSQVCDLQWLEDAIGSDLKQKVHDALCGQDPTSWNKRLTDAGFPEYYGYFLFTSLVQNNNSNSSMADLFTKFLTQVKDLTSSLSNLDAAELNRLQTILLGNLNNLTINQQFYQSFNWLNLMDNTTEGWLLGMLNFVTEINIYMESHLNLLKGMNQDIPLTVLLPNNTVVAQLLETTFGRQTAATILAFNLAPDKFFEVAFTNSWQEKVCQDVSTFASTFRIAMDSTTNITQLQHDLCKDLSKTDSVINSLLQRLDMNDVFKAFDDWMTGKTSGLGKVNNTNLYMAIQHKVEEFVATVTRVQNLTLTMEGLDAWFAPILKALEGLNTPQDGIGETCDAIVSYMDQMPLYRDSLRPILVSVYQNMQSTINQMQLQKTVEELICMKAVNSSDFIQKILSSNLTSLLQQILNPSMNLTGPFQCSEMVGLTNQISEMINASIYKPMFGGNLDQCGENFYQSFMMFVQDASSSFQLIQEILKMLTDPSLQGLLGNQDLLPVVKFFMKIYSQQQAVSLKFADIFTKSDNLSSILEKTFDLTPELVNSLLLSTLNVDVMKLANITSGDLEKILCSADDLGQILTLPNFSTLTLSEVSSTLCRNDTKEIADIFRTLLDIDLLSTLMNTNSVDLTWWTVTLGHLGDIIGHLNAFDSFPSLDFSSFDFNNLQADLLIYMQKILFDSGPEAIARSLNYLIADFAKLDPEILSEPLVKDIQTITLGLTSMKFIRNFIPPNVILRDVVKDRVAFLDYLTQQLNMSSSVADTLIQSTIQYASLLEYRDKDIHGLLCNATRLQSVLSLPQSANVSVTDVVTSLCSLSEEMAINLTSSLLMEADIGELVTQYVTNGLDSFLQGFNKTQDEIKVAVQKLTAAQSDFMQASKAFEESTKKLDLNIFLQPEFLTGSAAEQTLGDVLCGYETSRLTSSDASKDLTGTSSKLTGITKMVERQKIELSDMPASCKNIYDLVKGMDNGPVLWEYLKPLLWGKILYTPDTTISRVIVEKVYNSSFKALADVKTTISSWARGTKNLVDLMKNENMKSNLESILGNSLVDNMMTVMFGVSGSDFLDGFYSVDSVNTTQLDAIATIAKLMDDYIGCIVTDRFQAADTEAMLEKESAKLNIKKQFLAGLVFENVESSGNRKRRDTTVTLPKHVSYKIRMDIDNVMHTMRIKEQLWQPKPEDNYFSELRYLRGFIQLQDILDRSIISLQTGSSIDSPAMLQEFPTPCYTKDEYFPALATYLLPVLMTVAWLFFVALATRHLITDREKGQEEILKIMGMNSVLNWWVWFITTMAIMIIVSILCILALRVGKLFTFSDFGILILYFTDFCFSSIMLCYMVSSFFTRTTLALLTVVIVYFLSYFPFVVLTTMETHMLFWQKTLACLSSTTAFGFAAQYLSRYEILMEGIQWSNIKSSPKVGDDMSFSWTCWMMLIDGCVYMVIGWYVRNVKPGKYGVCKPWYFPVSPSYWGCSASTRSSNKYKKEQDGLYEPIDKHMRAGITIGNLYKKYGSTTVVNDINAEFYENQVTVLLGHNGAAKTTTMNMITGVLEPTSGSVRIYGKHPSKASKIGICPQHCALYDYMTVWEHMKFYGAVKSDWSKQKLEDNIYQLLKEVSLLHVQNSKVSELSGGMQRRLSVALAFVGGSKCVILDEPSSGVDPSARRAMWNLILKRKTNCTVLLSTHFLDEADIIGDRIAIMHNGKIMCTGSSHFLKTNLGSGYHLKIAKGGGFNPSGIMESIIALLPKACITENIGSEMTVSLSATTDDANNLQKCLHQLDVKGSELGIASYGLYDTTLEEVFMKVCDVSDRNIPMTPEVMVNLRQESKYKTEKSEETASLPDNGEDSTPYADPGKRVGVCQQSMQQIWALLLKRFHHYRRDWRMFITLILLPLLFVTAGLGFYTIKPTLSAPKRMMTPALYGPDSYMFVKDSVKTAMSQSMKDHLTKSPGPGTTCMTGMNLEDPFKCVNSDSLYHTTSSMPAETPKCSCVDKKHTCNAAANNLQVPWIKTNTTDIVQDLEGHDISNYLLWTRAQFTEKRYGGWSFEADGSKVKSTVWFNNKGHHSLPSFYNGLSNMMLRAMVPSNAQEYGITAYNHPIMLTDGQLSEDTLLQKAADYGIAMTFLVAFTFIPCGLAIYIVNEHTNKEKQLQFLSGVGPFMYWITSLVWDMLIYCIVVGLSVIIMAAFRNDAYWENDNLQAVVTLVILYGWASINMSYMTTKLYRDATTSYFINFCLSVLIGLVTMTIIFVLQFFGSTESVHNVYDVLKHLFKIFPPFCMVSGFVELVYNQIMSEILDRFGDDAYQWPFSLDVIGTHLIALAAAGLLFFIITLILEIRLSRQERSIRHEEEFVYLDEAVSNERSRVLSGYAKDDLFVMKNLTKEYTRGRREFYAVDHICLGVPQAECFGLLGENGAGKTTTFRMLTGDLLPSAGVATIKNQRITRGDASIGQEVGYCPQVEALDRGLTGRELLHCHARLRGLPTDSRNYVVNDLIKKFRMPEADKAVHTYSGGMKRKLSVAMAMIGEPPVVLLDEPTTGMDPKTRRHVWNILMDAVKNNQSVILSSHSMEECDALCTRLAIMVNGEFKCLGSPQHLKNMYGDGYIVTVYMSGLSTDRVRVREFFMSTFPGCHTRVPLVEENHGVLQIEIPKGTSSVADIFVNLEQVKEEFNVVHYSVSQTTLDNVFLNFTRDQNDGIIPEVYESSTDGSHAEGSWSRSSNEAFANPEYAYGNEGFVKDKDMLPVKFISDGRNSPVFSTKM